MKNFLMHIIQTLSYLMSAVAILLMLFVAWPCMAVWYMLNSFRGISGKQEMIFFLSAGAEVIWIICLGGLVS